MREEDFETAIKVLVVGNGAVGKSSMIQRYCKGIFTKDYKKTIGVDFLERQLQVSGEDIRLMLWDTAGQEEFDSITKSYYRGAHVCVLAFSTTDRKSFEDIESWKHKVEDECGDIVMVLVQNKIDLIDEAAVDSGEAEDLAKRLKLKFYRTSVKDDFNVNDVFTYLTERHIEVLSSEQSDQQEAPQHQIGMFSGKDGKKAGGSQSSKPKSEQSQGAAATADSTFQLRPNKTRTGGKKKSFLSCMIL
eukprot:m.308299 g.308299  ORF g.308299 m.308299 type:complete len:246 (+) comp43717_c0_seq1:260-997(+)